MRTATLGSSDLTVSEIGLGCMSLPADEARAAAVLRRALDLGVTLFDTADLYDGGRNEEIVGRALRSVRDEVTIATKVGNRLRPGGGWEWTPDPAYLRGAVEASLRRLGVDVLDLLQLHGGTLDDPFDEVVATFDDLKARGLIRAYGISSIRPNVIRRWLGTGMVSVMMQYSLLDRRPEESVLDLLAERGVSVIARGPVARGLLAGRPAEPYLGLSEDEVAGAQRALAGVGPGTPAQRALRYSLAHPAVATAVPGASSVAQVEENVGAAALPPLAEREAAALREGARALRYDAHR